MNRRHAHLQNIDPSLWPTVDTSALSPVERKEFERRKRAVERYASGDEVRCIEDDTGINRRQLYRLVDRCLANDTDGRAVGYRGLFKYERLQAYTRNAPLGARGEQNGRGLAGAFGVLLERYPALSAWLDRKIRDRAITLHQTSTEPKLKTRLSKLKALHTEFISRCRSVGLNAADYPLNTDRGAIRSLSAYLTAEILNDFGRATRTAGASRPKGMPRTDGDASRVTRPYQVVEFDGHRLDVRLKIVIEDPLGFTQEFEIERIWLLVIIDVATRAVLGYHLALSREYSRYDVIKTIDKALTPHAPRSFTLEGVGYGEAGGFPSGKFPELGYAIWERIRLDRAKANLAADTVSALCEFVGCSVDAGPPHQPDDRPYIERFFGTIASSLSSRLPGYTGSSPRDLRRALSDPKGSLRLFVSLSEMEQLMEAAIADYNATPHAGLNGRSPLEAMEYLVRGKGNMIQWLPEAKRRTMCLLQTAYRCRVRGYLEQGTRPHINFHQVRYTSPTLAASTHLMGQNLRIYYNSDDLRTVRAFLPDGTELGILKAQGAWGEIAHDLKLRQEIMTQRDNKRMRHVIDHDFLQRFVDDKRAKAKHSRRAASELVRTVRLLAQAPTTKTAPGPYAPQRPEPKPEIIAKPPAQDMSETIEPQKLTIVSGFTTAI